MDARTRRALEAAKAQAEVDRAAALEARDRLAAGISTATSEVAVSLRRVFEQVPDVAELIAGADEIAVHIASLVAGRFLEALKIEPRDPRLVKGSIAGPGGPFDYHAVIVDTTDALLPDSLTVSTVDPDNPAFADAPLVAMEVGGRINKTQDRHRLVMLGDVDTAASFITELYSLAARGRFTGALDAAVARRLEAMPTEGDQ